MRAGGGCYYLCIRLDCHGAPLHSTTISGHNPSGLSEPRLKSMRATLAGYVERGEIAAMVAVVQRHDETDVQIYGASGRASAAPCERDAIFRIASMSKPIVAVAAMILLEECKMRLDQSVEQWLPELANRRVLKTIDADLADTVKASRPITVRDVLTYRMGIGSVMAAPDKYPIQRQIKQLQIGGDGPPRPRSGPGPDQWLANLGSLPLMAQPGERWLYHTSADVLGVLIARVSGQSLGTFLNERIFEPLAMKDTGFYVPADKMDRLLPAYRFDYGKRKLEVIDDVENSAWSSPPAFESGGGGLLGTADDYFAFCKMLLNNGTLGGAKILSRAAVKAMTTDQLTDQNRIGAEMFLGDYRSWGFGIAVDTRRDQIYRSPGRFGWDGGFGTTAWVDPGEDMIGILLTQRSMDSPQPPAIFSDFWTLAYGAIN
jgi:CubicO group peptidase (beta-lactamase class C family)